MNRTTLSFLCAGLLLWAAPAMAGPGSDNDSALDFDGEFDASADDLADDGLVSNSADIDAEPGKGDVGVHGEVAVETEDGMVVVFKYRLQEPNKLVRKDDSLSLKQSADVVVELCFCADVTAYDAGECDEVEVGPVDGCSAKAKLDASEDPAELKVKVSCEDFDPAAIEGLDEAQAAKLLEVLDGDDDLRVKLSAQGTNDVL